MATEYTNHLIDTVHGRGLTGDYLESLGLVASPAVIKIPLSECGNSMMIILIAIGETTVLYGNSGGDFSIFSYLIATRRPGRPVH
jgi:hypothetical protein